VPGTLTLLRLHLNTHAAKCLVPLRKQPGPDFVGACYRRCRIRCAPPPVPRRCWCATWLLRPRSQERRCRASTLRHAQCKWSSGRRVAATSRPAGQPPSHCHSANSSRLVSGAAIRGGCMNHGLAPPCVDTCVRSDLCLTCSFTGAGSSTHSPAPGSGRRTPLAARSDSDRNMTTPVSSGKANKQRSAMQTSRQSLA
jgi:hypothetical protein